MLCIAIISDRKGKPTINAILNESAEDREKLNEILLTNHFDMNYISTKTNRAWDYVVKAIDLLSADYWQEYERRNPHARK